MGAGCSVSVALAQGRGVFLGGRDVSERFAMGRQGKGASTNKRRPYEREDPRDALVVMGVDRVLQVHNSQTV